MIGDAPRGVDDFRSRSDGGLVFPFSGTGVDVLFAGEAVFRCGVSGFRSSSVLPDFEEGRDSSLRFVITLVS